LHLIDSSEESNPAPHRPYIDKHEKNLFLRGLEKHLDFRLRANCSYAQEYYRLLAGMSCRERTAECQSRILSGHGMEVPTGDALLYHLKRIDPEEVLASFLSWNREILSQVDFPATGILAGDITTIPYFGQDMRHTVRSKEYRGTQYGFQIATIYLCHRGTRFTLHAVPVDQFSKNENVLKELLEEASRYVRPSLVLLDRGFYDKEVIRTLISMGTDFLMPAPKNEAVKRILKETSHLRAWVGRHVVGEGGPEVTIAVVPARDPEEKFVYITNRAVDTKDARALADVYDSRWGIETSFRVMKDTGPWTTSNEYSVRLLFHLLMVILYNLWVLVNRLMQPEEFDERLMLRMEDFLEILLDTVKFRKRASGAA